MSAVTEEDLGQEAFELRVVRVVDETHEARSITFEVPPPAAARFAYAPGQFLTLAIPSDRTGVVARNYSLSSSPPFSYHPGDHVTITVKRTAGGYASNWICDHVQEGDSLHVLPPAGVFTPSSLDADLLLFAAGSGITPVMSIVRAALARGTGQVVVFYANRDAQSVIFAAELDKLVANHPDRLHVTHWWESDKGLPTAEALTDLATAHKEYEALVCGPTPFMALTTGVLRELDFPRERRRQEKFVSLTGNPFGTVPSPTPIDSHDEPTEALSTLAVTFDGERHVFDDWAPTTTMLEHMESKGIDAPYSCREGQCATCVVRLVSGEVEMAANDVLDDTEVAEGMRLACQSTPASDQVIAVVYD